LSNAPQSELDAMFYKVAASFRAVNKRAIAAANVPFQIKRGKRVIDDSTSWENKVGFLLKPKDLIRRISLSLTFTNKAYLLRGKDVLSQTKSLKFLVPTTIQENHKPRNRRADALRALGQCAAGKVPADR
jgi:DNA recombination-dependent growth factor C